jgi:hypothetical protein
MQEVYYAELTLRELIYFTMPFDKTNELTVDYKFYRDEITRMVRERMERPTFPRHYKAIVEKHLSEIEFAFKNIPNFTKEFGSTARRINTLVNNPNLSMIFGHRKGVNFDKLISDGWVILVNASTGSGLGTLQSRLLATVLINQIIATIERLRYGGFNKPYYLYLDEAEQYATDKLIEVLDTKRNIKLRMILSNHYPSQFTPAIMKAVKSQTKTQIAFYVQDSNERRDVAGQFYGGNLKPDDVEYALRQQQKRQAVMKLGKAGAVIAKTHEVPDIKPNKEFLKDLLSHKNYATIDEIFNDYDDRFSNIQSRQKKDTGVSERRTTTDKQTNNETASWESALKRAKAERDKQSSQDASEDGRPKIKID